MIRKINFAIPIVLLIAMAIPLLSFGQKNNSDDGILVGTVFFRAGSFKLSKEGKDALDAVFLKVKDSELFVKAVSSNKDLCEECTIRNLKRISSVKKYLSQKGIPDKRLIVINRLQGETDRVDIFLSPVAEDAKNSR